MLNYRERERDSVRERERERVREREYIFLRYYFRPVEKVARKQQQFPLYYLC